MSEARHILSVGTLLFHEQYEILSVLGQGGFGITYLAQDRNLDRQVAIKECFPNTIAVREDQTVLPKSTGDEADFDWVLKRFLREARLIAQFKHPNIVQVLQIFEANNTAYMVLEYLEGCTLEDVLESLDGPPKEAWLREVLMPILDALELVHSRDQLHRDIAPDNIYLLEDSTPILIDFGAARDDAAKHSRKLSSFPVIKDGYSPNEQYFTDGNQGPWTDIYALGATLYRAITGKRPMSAPARNNALIEDEPDPLQKLMELKPEGYSQAMLEAVDQALAPQPKRRPKSAALWSEMLAKEPTPTREPVQEEKPPTTEPRAGVTVLDERSNPAPVQPKQSADPATAKKGSAGRSPGNWLAPPYLDTPSDVVDTNEIDMSAGPVSTASSRYNGVGIVVIWGIVSFFLFVLFEANPLVAILAVVSGIYLGFFRRKVATPSESALLWVGHSIALLIAFGTLFEANSWSFFKSSWLDYLSGAFVGSLIATVLGVILLVRRFSRLEPTESALFWVGFSILGFSLAIAIGHGTDLVKAEVANALVSVASLAVLALLVFRDRRGQMPANKKAILLLAGPFVFFIAGLVSLDVLQFSSDNRKTIGAILMIVWFAGTAFVTIYAVSRHFADWTKSALLLIFLSTGVNTFTGLVAVFEVMGIRKPLEIDYIGLSAGVATVVALCAAGWLGIVWRNYRRQTQNG